MHLKSSASQHSRLGVKCQKGNIKVLKSPVRGFFFNLFIFLKVQMTADESEWRDAVRSDCSFWNGVIWNSVSWSSRRWKIAALSHLCCISEMKLEQKIQRNAVRNQYNKHVRETFRLLLRKGEYRMLWEERKRFCSVVSVSCVFRRDSVIYK